MKTLDPEIYHDDIDTDHRRAQIIYLSEVLHYTYDRIATITRYAYSTVVSYATKFIDLLDSAKQWFEKRKRRSVQNYRAAVASRVETYPQTFCAYVIELLNDDGQIVWTKIGKANDILDRCDKHLRYDNYKKEGVTNILIKELYYTENEDDALTIENELRKAYKEVGEYIAKDRFILPYRTTVNLENSPTWKAIFELLKVQQAPQLA